MHRARQLCLPLLLATLTASPGAATPTPQPTPPTASTAPTCALPTTPLPSAKRAVIVLDTSGSMRGIGDGQANIFDKVKGSIAQYVQSAQPDQLELITFDSGIRSTHSYALPDDQARFTSDLDALHADGRNTYLYRSLQAALSPLTGAEKYITNVYVLTDGIDNDRRRRETAQSALNAFTKRSPLDTLTYIALGTQIPTDAREALQKSNYASGLPLPVGQVPDLNQIGTGVLRVTDASHVPVPFPDGSTLTLAPNAAGVTLTQPRVQAGEVALHVPARLPYGTPALLCALPSPNADMAFPHTQRLLLDLNVGQEGSGLNWLNPGANLKLSPGQSTVLRYRALNGVPLGGARLILPRETQGLSAALERAPGAREFAVRLTNTGTPAPQTLLPQLRLDNGRLIELPRLTTQAGEAPTGTPGRTPLSEVPATSQSRWRWLLWLLPLLLLGALGAWWWSRQRRKGLRRRPLPRLAASPAPTIQGIEYRDDRTIALVTGDGEVSGVTTPLGGPFDIGRLARVPLLSGLRAEQHRDGLRILNIPGDLEVSQGGRLLHVGDEVRPGTLLGVEVARQARAPHAPLGSLVGLGLPLTLKPDGVTLNLQGPYGTHALTLQPGVTDLGDAFNAPALAGLKFSTSGPNILLADVPGGMTLTRAGESAPLRPGTYITAPTTITIPTNE